MRIRYDKNGNCETCGLPGSGFVEDGVCQCLEREEAAERWREATRYQKKKGK